MIYFNYGSDEEKMRHNKKIREEILTKYNVGFHGKDEFEPSKYGAYILTMKHEPNYTIFLIIQRPTVNITADELALLCDDKYFLAYDYKKDGDYIYVYTPETIVAK